MIHEILEKKSSDFDHYVSARDTKFNVKPGAVYGPVIRKAYVIECCTKGKSVISINGKEFNIKAGDCYVLLPGDIIIHKNDPIHSREGLWCIIDGIKMSSYMKKLNITSSTPFLPAEAFEIVKAQIEKMVDSLHEYDPGAKLRRRAYIHELIGELLRFTKNNTDINSYIENAINMIEMRYSEDISIPQIASYVGLERCYFTTIFKEYTGKSPHNYLTEYRIKKACKLLEENNMYINELAVAVGIKPENFARVFKKYMGKSVREYKKTTL